MYAKLACAPPAKEIVSVPTGVTVTLAGLKGAVLNAGPVVRINCPLYIPDPVFGVVACARPQNTLPLTYRCKHGLSAPSHPVYPGLAISIAAVLWLGLAILVATTVADSLRGRAVVLAVFSSLPLILVVMLAHEGKQFRQEQDRQQAEIERRIAELTSVSEIYLTTKCKTHQRVLSVRLASAPDGVLVDVDPVRRLTLDAPGVHIGERVDIHDYQYFRPIYWLDDANSFSVSERSRFAFVEQRNGATLNARAAKPWWETQGQAFVSPADADSLTVHLFHMRPNERLAARVSEGHAKYTFTARDISTAEDRENWVARGELRLMDQATNELVAEYVGFAAAAGYGFSPNGTSSFGYTARNHRLCPEVGDIYVRDRLTDIVSFFFMEVVKYAP